MSLMLDKLRSIDANEMANIRNIVKNDVESGAMKWKSITVIEEIRDVDVFNFIQDIVDLMKHIELQEQLDAYIKSLENWSETRLFVKF